MQNQLPKLCIISLYSYPLFNPDCHGPFGGSEVRISLIARELAKRGKFDVHMIVFDHGQPKLEQREGITFYAHSGYTGPSIAAPEPTVELTSPTHEVSPLALPTTPGWKQRLYERGLRLSLRLPTPIFRLARLMYHALRKVKRGIFFAPVYLRYRQEELKQKRQQQLQTAGHIGSHRVEKIRLAVYDQVNADIYMLPGNNNMAAELAFYCQQRDKAYVFLSGSDGDYQPAFKEQPPNTLLYYGSTAHLLVYAVKNATVHIVQNDYQAGLLRQHYNRDAVVIRNPVDLTRIFPKIAESNTILWVGKSDRVKRPEIILDLARCFPEFCFTIIMNLSLQDIFDRCVAEARQLPNVTMIHYVPYQEVEQYFAAAKLFVNTSVFEGFPNTFLQAAKYQLPIVSLKVDPGEMLSQHGCGRLCAGDFEQLKENVRLLMTQHDLYSEISTRCSEYIHTYHDKDNIMTAYESALSSILAADKT